MRWNLKEAVGKPLVRRTEIAYKARLREMSWHKATKSDNYHISGSIVNEKSAEPIVVEKSL